MKRLAELWHHEEGQDLVEYALLLAFVALAAIALLGGVGHNISKIWVSINTTVSSAAS